MKLKSTLEQAVALYALIENNDLTSEKVYDSVLNRLHTEIIND